MSITTQPAPATTAVGLSLTRLHVMRAGYLLMGLGLAVAKWPLLPAAHTLPHYEGIAVCLLTAMSLLALLFGAVLLVALDLISDAMRKSREGK